MRKRDLQTGMTVRLRGKGLYLVMLDCCTYERDSQDLLINNDGYLKLSLYTSTLLINRGYIWYRPWDIIEIYASETYCNIKNQNRLISIWKREEF